MRGAPLGSLLALCALPALAEEGPARTAFIAAAQALIAETVAEGCNDQPGRMTSIGVIVRDLDGDGRDDLVLSHEGVECGIEASRSLFCGAQVCTTRIYLYTASGLIPQAEVLGSVIDLDGSEPPVIHIAEHGGTRLRLRWTGEAFDPQHP